MPSIVTRTLALITPGAHCPVTLHSPAEGAPFPAVILFMDGPGIRPAIQEMAGRLAASGYAVFLPDLFYRAGPYEPVDPKVVFTNPDLRAAHREKYMATASPRNVMADTAVLIAAIDEAPEAAPGPIGVVGYCMGGKPALFAGATYPDRIAAAASYHGGGLAGEGPGSPHLLLPKIAGKVYVAGAIEDSNFTDEQKATLTAAMEKAGIEHVVETYPAKHGWVPGDTPAHDPAEAEHHWQTLVPFFDSALILGA